MANEDEKIEICRLCGKESRNCFAIFQDEDNILEKINTCLPIDISPNDKLPSNICRCCSYRLSMSYKLRCTAVEVDERLRMQLHQRQSDDVYTNKNANNFSENFLNIKRQIIDEENVLHYQNGTQEIRDKINIYNNWKTKREVINEISNKKETVISTEDNETAASVILVTEIVEIKYEDVMEALIEQTDNSSDFVKNETANDCQRFSEHQTLEQNEQSFYCHTCKIKFEKERYFKTHMNIHEENTVNCTCCSAKCSSMYDLFLHKRKKHNMFKNIKRLKYACTKCDKFFAHSSTWENHNKNKCTNMTDKCCKYCKANFTTRTKLILHLKNEHQNIHLEHKCNRCDAVFKEKLVLAEHTREIHNLQSPNKLNTKEKYVCKFCGKKFNSWKLWKNHERIHTEETLSSKCHKSFRIIEFNDGVAIVPSLWLNEAETKCYYPTFRDQIKLKKYVASQQPPEDNMSWKIYDVVRIFYRTNSYETAKEKLLLAEQLSDFTEGGTEDESGKCEKEKKSRHMRAKRNYSSSEESEFDCDGSKKLKKFPEIPKKLNMTKSTTITESQKIPPSSSERSKSQCQINPAKRTKSLYKGGTTSKDTESYISSSDENDYLQNSMTEKKYINKSTTNIVTEDAENEFRKEVIRKLQLLLNKITVLENRMVLLETSGTMRQINQEVADVIQYEEYELPLQTMVALLRLEELLKDKSFANKLVNTLKQVGGVNLSNIIHNILKKIMSDNIAQNFSYLGQRNKRNFSALKICTILNRVVRMYKPEAKDTEIAEIVSSWLVYAKWRQQRAEIKIKKQQQPADEENQ